MKYSRLYKISTDFWQLLLFYYIYYILLFIIFFQCQDAVFQFYWIQFFCDLKNVEHVDVL